MFRQIMYYYIDWGTVTLDIYYYDFFLRPYSSEYSLGVRVYFEKKRK